MIRTLRFSLALLTLSSLLFGCGAERRFSSGDSGGVMDGGGTDGGGTVDASFGCNPGEMGCFGNTYYRCGDDARTRLDETICDDACDPVLACVFCAPGSRRCEGSASMVCTADGLAWVTARDCSEWGSSCGANGFCADACGDAEASQSNIGCEYWPTPLANTAELNPTAFDFRVIVANPNVTPVNIEITRGSASVASVVVDPNGLAEIPLAWIPEQSFGIPANAWTGIVTSDGAYRLRSDQPVTVAQLNPFEYSSGADYSYTNDATLLFPTHVLTGDYVASSYVPFSRTTGTRGGLFPDSNAVKMPGYMAVVGLTPEPTRVEVFLAGNVAGDAGGRWPAGSRGTSITFTLARGEVAHIPSAIPPDCAAGRPGYNSVVDSDPFFGDSFFDTCRETDFDVTGSRITASQPVAVFGGHVCAYVPYQAQACDHLEAQLAPLQTWGRDYVTTPMIDTGSPRPNLIRVVAAFDATSVTLDPPQAGVGTVTLAAGEWVEALSESPVHITGSRAIQVSQYLLGQNYTEPAAARGDPAMTVLVPREQWRLDYVFATPSSYNASTNGQSYVLITRPAGLEIRLDGSPISASWSPVGALEVGIVPLEGGTHRLEGADSFGVIVYGMGTYTSYAYPAGLDFEPIVLI